METMEVVNAALGRKPSPKKKSQPAPPAASEGVIAPLLFATQRLMELADRIGPTLLIRHNDWLVQVKAFRQHYLFENDDSLAEIQQMSQSVLEVVNYDGNQQNLMYTITHDEAKGFVVKDEKKTGKSTSIQVDDPKLVSRLMQLLR
jgi:hypothetical protein